MREKDWVAAEHKFAYRALSGVGAFVVRRPRAVIAVYALLTVVALLVTAFGLELKTAQNDLVSNDLPYNQRYLRFLRDFGDLEYLYVVIAVDDRPEVAAAVADAVALEVGALDPYVDAVYHKLPPEALGRNILLRPEISREHLSEFAGEIESAVPMLGGLERIDRFSRLLDFFSEALDPAQLGNRHHAAEKGGQLLGLTLSSITAAARGESPPTLKDQAEEMFWKASEHPRNRGYLFSRNGRLAFVEILPKKNFETLGVIREPLAAIRRAIDRVRRREEFRQMDFGLTGRLVLQADEMETTNHDMARGTIGALVAVILLFVLVFRRLRRPLLAGLTLIVAIILTFGVATLTVGHLTLLSIVFAAMLVGLGIDFGIHFLARYQDELRATDDIDVSICRTLTSTGVGIGTGGVTTALAFFSTLLVDFQGLQELGFVAGVGVLICVASTLTFLPALVAVTDHYLGKRRKLHPAVPVRVPFLHMAARHPKAVLVILAVPTLLGLPRFQFTPSYNFNLLDLQAEGLESVRYEKLFFKESDRSTWFAAYVLENLEDVDRILAALAAPQRLGIVGTVESVRDHVSVDQDERRAILQPAYELIHNLELPAGSEAVDLERLSEALNGLRSRLRQLESAAHLLASPAGGDAVSESVAGLRELTAKVDDLLQVVGRTPGAQAHLESYQVRWCDEVRQIQRELGRILSPRELTPESLPPVLRHRYLSKDGSQHLVYAYPVKDIWEEDHMEEFVAWIKAVDPDVTGTPIQVHESATLMRDGFLRAALYSIIMVAVLLFIDLRSLTQTCWVMIPLAGGLFWLLELLPYLGLSFNLANFFSLPILIGIGVDGGVHVMHRFRETASTDDVLRTTGSAVTLSFVTTILGFGALSFAQHRGVASLGYLTVLGSSTICLANTLLLPALLELWTRAKRR